LAPLIGARPGEVIITDSVSVNIFSAVAAALSLNPGRRTMLSETGNFPTDLYMLEGLAHFSSVVVQTGQRFNQDNGTVPSPRSQEPFLCKIVAPAELMAALNPEVAVLVLTQVHYKTAEIKDLAAITAAAQAQGILTVWDLSHSVGSIPVDLTAANADFAVGCGYKFLNGGPGAPAFLYVAERHQAAARPVLSGWMGHQDPFAFTDDYTPASGIERFRCGTPPILSLTALEAGIEVFAHTDILSLRAKAIQLSQCFISLMEQEVGNHGFSLLSPEAAERRGGHLTYHHAQGYGIYQALKAEGIVSDYRTPGGLRFGITPLYMRFADVFHCVQALKNVVETQSFDRPEYRQRAKIT
ncbi:MAG: kynureninase, partial [Lewinella sp.]|nr:kynureninase [Lewinella sp.]